jgi:hypothetical protein
MTSGQNERCLVIFGYHDLRFPFFIIFLSRKRNARELVTDGLRLAPSPSLPHKSIASHQVSQAFSQHDRASLSPHPRRLPLPHLLQLCRKQHNFGENVYAMMFTNFLYKFISNKEEFSEIFIIY